MKEYVGNKFNEKQAKKYQNRWVWLYDEFQSHIDEYVDDIYTVIDLALEEERLEIIYELQLLYINCCCYTFHITKTSLLELI